jgi:DNA polymerase V
MTGLIETQQVNNQVMAYQTPYEKTAVIDLRKLLVPKSDTTFFAKVKGDGMMDLGIAGGDILVIDIAVTAANGDIVVCATEDGFTIRKLLVKGTQLFLSLGDVKEPVTADGGMMVWGVVTSRIRKSHNQQSERAMATA